MTRVSDPLFTTLDDDTFLPGPLTRGPWSADSQHGGAPAALVARALDAMAADQPMQVARLTVELLRPVPITPVRLTTSVERPGRKVQLLTASLHAGDTEVVRARALRIRVDEALAELGGHQPPDDPVAPVPDTVDPGQFAGMPSTWEGFHNTAMDVRFVEGAFAELGPGTAWFRLTVPVVDDEDTRPLSRVAAASDFGNGISRVFTSDRTLFINPDLTIHLARMPQGEWVALRSGTSTGPAGIAMAESALFDGDGRIGRAVQSLLLDRR